ncbi:MAG: cytochrome d ubiquinol oxidase subunit II [Bacteroidales bacterium]|jgi:cytochrome d ubiquinol oxidase subunit II|nr:cytochrome d ubiquinol oxidase subunit II [Bacteroidales bacterium]
MFETLDYSILQHYWYAINALLGALLVFLLFVQGGQTLIYTIGKNELEKKILVNALGRKWEFTFTTLVTFGGAFFASFPLFYSTSFGGAYWVWMIILFAFIIQAVSYEYRTKPNNFLGQKTFEIFLIINGVVATVFLGTAVATFFTGSPFHIDDMNRSFWDSPFRGLELALDFTRYTTFINLSLGLAVFFLSRVLANLYFMNSIYHKQIFSRARKSLLNNAIPFKIFFLFFVINILLRDGYAINADTKEIFMEPYKYLHNLLQMPFVMIIFLLGVILVLFGIIRAYFSSKKCGAIGIWFTGIGTVLTVFGLFLIAGFNNTAYYPSNTDIQSSITIFNSSSSQYTLVAMSYVSLMVPFVLAYIIYAWRAMNKKKIDANEMKDDSHAY